MVVTGAVVVAASVVVVAAGILLWYGCGRINQGVSRVLSSFLTRQRLLALQSGAFSRLAFRDPNPVPPDQFC